MIPASSPELLCAKFEQISMGPWVFGIALDLLLFGVLTVQTYMYYLAFQKDRKLLKLAVTWVYLVGAAQTLLAMVDLTTAFNNFQGNNCALSGNNHFWLTVVAFGAAVALVTQLLYAYRIYIISHKTWILILVICLSLGQLATSLVGCFCLFGSKVVEAFLVGGRLLGVCATGFGWVWGPLNFFCDATITVSMSILLLKQRKGTLAKTTHAHITKIIRLIVETGLATSIVVVVYTMVYNLTPTPYFVSDLAVNTVWLTPGLAMGKVYSNSMLALLNSRLTIAGGRNTGDPFGTPEIRSEVLRTEVGENETTAVTRHRIPHQESSDST